MNIPLFDYHSDSQDIIDKYYSLLMSEADRGSILLGVSILDEQLNEFFKKITPPEISKKKQKLLFDSRGAFGELASKLDIALVCNLIPKNIIDSIHKLRKLRNDLAHKTSPFSLKENLSGIFDVFTTLDKTAPSSFLGISRTLVYEDYINQVLELNSESSPNEKLFSSKEEVIEFIHGDPDLLDKLMEKRVKVLFIVGVSTLAALIIFHREIAIENMAK